YILAGRIPETADQTWAAVNQSLVAGHRGLPGGDSLAQLLFRCREARLRHLPPPLTVGQILAWADTHNRRTGAWPGGHDTRQVADAPKGTTWTAIELALSRGKRGLPGGVTLAQLLEQHRGVRNRMDVPDLTVAQILVWADEHDRRTGSWPKYNDGPVRAAPGETWAAVDTALFKGIRGLPGGESLRQVLARCRGVRNKSALPSLKPRQIRLWAEAHRERNGSWPAVKSGPIPEAPGETWSGVNAALTVGMRGLPGGDSLARLLDRECGKRNPAEAPSLTLTRIRKWVKSHHAATGEWPKYTSGPIPGVAGETWGAVDNALHKGRRGLSGGLSLAQIVRECQAGG
ncbi:MAG TPA: hypothetical protein VH092_00185, partial [Urbifossiella sp.]|nr:hypothetical protein [Urbifossiella sp.]